MKLISSVSTRRATRACVRLAAAVIFFAAGSAFAKTPDGMPPSEETVCGDLSGAAFGLCNAYCEAQDCDVHPRPSCPVLRRNFEKLTGSAVFPCDPACGNGIGDPGEECDPPGLLCTTGVPCSDDCTCETGPGVCCQCVGTAGPTCQDNVPPSTCQAQSGCTIGALGTTCDSELGRCQLEPTNCCRCPDDTCTTVASPDLCPTTCEVVPAPSMCDAAGNCQSFPEPVP